MYTHIYMHSSQTIIFLLAARKDQGILYNSLLLLVFHFSFYHTLTAHSSKLKNILILKIF